MKKEGSIFTVLSFPEQWPPKTELTILSTTNEQSEILIQANQDGSLELRIDSLKFVTSPIVFVRAHRALLSVHWNTDEAEKIKVFANSIQIKADNKEIFKIDSNYEIDRDEQPPPPKEINTACLNWIQWRKHRYGSSEKKEPKKNRITKTTQEQIEELNAALVSLKNNFEMYGNDRLLLVINTLPILRSLLFWPDKKGPYNPLLLRLAGLFNLALPVYALAYRIRDTKDNQLFKDATTHRVYNFPSLKKKHRNEILMDFQEWLNMDFQRLDKNQCLRWKDLIFDGANTMSASHFDDDKLKYLDELSKSIVWDKSDLVNYLVCIIGITLDYGQIIIKTAANNGYKTQGRQCFP
jgi:hypothetical protein